MNTARLLFFALLLALGTNKAIAQCAENIRMYELGMQLFKEGNYRKAAEAFAVVDSLDNLDFDEYDNRKGYGKQWEAHCYYNMNNIEKAKALSESDYDILPVDRRLMQIPDSLCNLALNFFLIGKYEDAEHYYSQSVESARSLKLTHSISYFNCCVSKAQMVASAGKKTAFVNLADSILAEFDREFPNHHRVRKYIMKSLLCDTAFEIYDFNLFGHYFELIVSYLRETEQYKDPFTMEILNSYANMLLHYGQFHDADKVVDEMLRLAEVLFGRVSPQYSQLLSNLININTQLKRLDLAKKYIDLEEDLIALQKGTGKTETNLLNHAHKASFYIAQGNMEEAIQNAKWLYKHADYKTQSGREVLSVAIPLVSMLKSIQGKVDKELIEEMIRLSKQMDGDASNEAKLMKVLFMPAFITAGYAKEAVQIADELNKESSANFQLYYSCMMVYLVANEYVKARKNGHQALVMLNKELAENKNVAAALAQESNIDNGLILVETARKQNKNKYLYSIPDTIKYSLNLLNQDLLHAKLRIFELKDSIGSEPFMSTLESFYFLARNENSDIVVADSIMNEYATKLSNIYGEDSEQLRAIVNIKEHCEFERSNVIAGFALRRHEKGSILYNRALDEYNKEFAEWKHNKENQSKQEQTPKDTEPTIPYVWTIERVSNTDSLFKEVWKSLAYYEINGKHSGLMYRADTWCYVAQKANRIDSLVCFAKRILPQLGSFDRPKLMGYVWLYAGEEIFDECLQLLFDGAPNDSEFELSSLLHAINEYRSYCQGAKLESIMRRINRIIDKYKHSTDKDDRIRYYSAQIFTNLVRWRNSVFWRIDKNQLKEDFVNMYHEIGKEQTVWKYGEFNKALDVACLLYEYNDKDSIIVEINRTRILAQVEAAKANNEDLINSRNWMLDGYEGLLFPMLTIFSYVDLHKDEFDKVYSNVYHAYRYQKKYERDYDFYHFWYNFFKKRFYHNDEALSKHIERLLGDMVSSYFIKDKKDERLNGLVYDLTIWNKGYLLRSDQQVTKVLLESGNTTISERYKEYINLKQRMSDSKNDEEQTQSLQQQAESIWDDLKRESKTFDDYTKRLEASWKDVQACLGDKDMAIEYVSTGRGEYYALLLKKDYTYPLIENVGFIDNVVKQKGDSIYTEYLSYNNPWPMMRYDTETKSLSYPLKGIENVYFSPAGSINKLSIENMKADWKGDSLMCEKYHLYRLSNTRDLIQKKSVPSNAAKRKTILFGGINYDFSQEEWTAASTQNIDSQLLALRSNDKDGRGAQNASLSYLKGTKTEVDAISSVLKANRVKYACYSGNDATEDMFKSLSSQGVTSLHIATHGFYSSDSVRSNNEYDRDFEIKEDKSMMQNGLYFAGANANFYGDEIPDNVNDGVLSAQEVSYLDFTDCSLVTLSACETGLGEVSGEGVFGLQRGFKKAGVNSILMSLWKVDDEATCKLMTEFYRNWIAKKMTKYDALEAAKKVVRETKGWENPKYWASFILLDAID